MIRYDRSWNSIVIICDQCPHWRALALEQGEAYASAERHQVRVHGIHPSVAATPRRLWERRHAG